MKKINKLYLIRIFFAILIFAISTVAMLGFSYSIHVFDLQLLPLLQRNIVDFSVISILLLSGIIALTLIFGRLYCSTICPLGILQEIIGEICHRKNSVQKNLPIKYFILAIVLGGIATGSTLFARFTEPYTLFGNIFSATKLGICAIILVGIIVIVKNRFFCTNICPVGAILGLLAKISLLKINIPQDVCVSCGACVKVCPSGCIDTKEKYVDNETCVKCLKCLNVCPKGGITYSKAPKTTVKFNPKRRGLIISAATIAFLGTTAKISLNLKDKITEKIKNIILPAGAKDEAHMLNTCLNCNLCVKNCPNKILVKANENFSTAHIDYDKGEGFCKYDCNNCSKVCPAGAIKKMSLEEKQNTRIAMATINNANCTKCMACIKVCPKRAISFMDRKVQIDGSKCIGCGACKQICNSNAIEIFSVKKQSII